MGDEFEVQSASSSIFHLSDSSTRTGANWCKYVVADQDFRWGFLKALCAALRAPHGVLYRDAPLSTVIGVIRTLERHYGDLMDDVEVMIEEGDGVDVAALKQRIARRRCDDFCIACAGNGARGGLEFNAPAAHESGRVIALDDDDVDSAFDHALCLGWGATHADQEDGKRSVHRSL